MAFLLILYALLGLLLFSLIFIYLKLVRPSKYIFDELRKQGVPSEPFVPIFGQSPQLIRARKAGRLMEYQDELVRKHGYCFLFSFGPFARLVVLDPDKLADILGRTSSQNYGKPADFRARFKPLIGLHNLLVSEGHEHERARKMLNPAFHFVNLKSMISIMGEQTRQCIDALFESSSTSEQSVNLQTLFSSLTLSIIASSAFGKGFETIANARDIICRAFTEVLEAVTYRGTRMISSFPIISQLPFWRKHIVDNGIREVANFVDQIITDRRQGKSMSLCAGDDILDLLLSAVDADGKPFNDEEIKQQALTFVLAGHETTGNLMTWMMYVLMTNKAVLHACQEEVDRVLPNGISPTNEHLSDLVICEAVLQETLRLYPPAPFFVRQCIHEHTIGSEGQHQLRIPIRTTVLVNTYLLHRRADYWPRPLEFDYTRWMRDPVTGLKPKLAHPFCYLPFAAGPRNCIGQNFALLEAKIMLAMFVQRCDFGIEPGQTIIPEVRITMRPKYGLQARISKRK